MRSAASRTASVRPRSRSIAGIVDRATRSPFALTALSTHDTKRNEDVRARINVLSEIPDRWFPAVERWSTANARHRIRVEEKEAPDRNEEYFLYQNLLGAWPLEAMDDQAFAAFRDRIRAFMAKAIHEAKVHSSWQNPNPEYDEAIDQFILALLDREGNREFLDDFVAFQRFVSHHGLINSLAQTLLKIAAPGVPDTYQGTEVWDFSLVDPDNRRPVDYRHRASMLDDLVNRFDDPGNGPAGLCRDLIATPADGRIKLYTTWRALAVRRHYPGLFSVGRIPAGPGPRSSCRTPLRLPSPRRQAHLPGGRASPEHAACLARHAPDRCRGVGGYGAHPPRDHPRNTFSKCLHRGDPPIRGPRRIVPRRGRRGLRRFPGCALHR